MHIPDGFLTPDIWMPMWFISISGIAYCLRKLRKTLKEKMVPLMGVMSAFVFAAQMLNFPVISGTSGHLLGGVLAAALLGPYAAAIVLSIVLVVQCLIFQDGGLTVLGANIFNISFVATIGGYLVYVIIRKLLGKAQGIVIATCIASWSSIVFASAACAIELAMSGTAPLKVVAPAMVVVHALIGIGEAMISGLVIKFILGVRPDLIYGEDDKRLTRKEVVLILLIVAFLVFSARPFVSKMPDGLERIAQRLGFIDKALPK